MRERIHVIIKKQLIQLLRAPRMRVVLFVPPMLQLIIFGYAVNMDVETVRTAWMDADRTPASREMLARFQGSGRFQIVASAESGAEIEELLDTGAAVAAVRVPSGFGRDLVRGRQTTVQIIIDGTDSNTGSLVGSYASEIIASYGAKVAFEQQVRRAMSATGAGGGSKVSEVETRARVWFNPNLKSRNYFIPGVIVNLTMVVTVMLTAMAIVREKEMGTIEQLMMTPIRPIELIIGMTVPFAAIGLMDVVLVTSLALLIFNVPFRGDFLFLLFCALLFLLTSVGVGLYLSTISRTQQQALMSSFFFATPAFMLSGFMFPIQNMPVVVQYFTYLNPLRHFMEIVRGVFLKGVGVSVLWPQMLWLAISGIAVLLLGAVRLKRGLN